MKLTSFQEEMHAIQTDITADAILEGNIEGDLAQALREQITPIARAINVLCWRFLPYPPENVLKVDELVELGVGFQYMCKFVII